MEEGGQQQSLNIPRFDRSPPKRIGPICVESTNVCDCRGKHADRVFGPAVRGPRVHERYSGELSMFCEPRDHQAVHQRCNPGSKRYITSHWYANHVLWSTLKLWHTKSVSECALQFAEVSCHRRGRRIVSRRPRHLLA